MRSEPFELSMLGGAVERQWRRARPDIEALPWGTIDVAAHTPEAIARGRRFWTTAAFQEHKTAAACAATLQALVAARAPVDLIALASGFMLDEMAHVELCARVASELGGGAPLPHDASALLDRPPPDVPPLLHAASLVVRVFCVGEAVSVPLQRATARSLRHPLLKAVTARIAKDEAAHGRFGWIFLDWAGELLDEDARVHLRRVAAEAIASFEALIAAQAGPPQPGPSLGWLARPAWEATARRALDAEVREPLRARGLG